MTTENPPVLNAGQQVNVVVLLDVLWRYRIFMGVFIAACISLALYLALSTPFVYRAEVIVTPVTQNGVSEMGGLASRFGGLASLAGFNLSGSGSSVQEAQAVLKSRHLAETFVERYKLTDELLGNSPRKTTWRAADKFRQAVLSIRQEKEAGTTVVAINWRDPAEASAWANGYVALANEMLRNRALADASRNIKFLNEQISKTSVVEIQRVIYGLVESETKNQMLASTREQYAFTVVDPAVTPEDRIWPRRGVIVVSGAFLGGVLAALLVLLFDFWRRNWSKARA